MNKLVLFTPLLLSACAGRLVPANVSGTSAYVSVGNIWNAGEALPYATKHCAEYGKVPRLTHMEGYSAIFDCVAP